MTELERTLAALGPEIDWPPAPDLAPRVVARVERRRFRLRLVAVALATLVVAIGAAFAVPGARTAILRFFHLGGVTVERVETLPAARERPLAAGLGEPLPRAEAERRAGLRLALPPAVHPTRFYARPGIVAALVRFEGRPVLLAAIAGEQLGLVKKFAGPAHVEPVEVNGRFGIWISGGPHVLQYQRRGVLQQIDTRLAGNTLLWLSGGDTLRIEGRLSRADAIELGESMR
jgi:hypothetical protein